MNEMETFTRDPYLFTALVAGGVAVCGLVMLAACLWIRVRLKRPQGRFPVETKE